MESMRLSPQLVGFSVDNDGGMRMRLCGKKKRKFGAAQPVSIHGGRRSLPGWRTKPAFVWGQSVRLCLVADSQPHARTTLAVRGPLCTGACDTFTRHRSHRGAGTDHTHTHTFTHAYRHTHMPHAFTHTEQIKQVDCTAQCRRDAATSGFKICLSFLVMNAKGFFSLFFFLGWMKGLESWTNACSERVCGWETVQIHYSVPFYSAVQKKHTNHLPKTRCWTLLQTLTLCWAGY